MVTTIMQIHNQLVQAPVQVGQVLYLRVVQAIAMTAVGALELNNLANEVSGQLIEHFGERVYRTLIPRNVRLAEAPSYGQPALIYDRESRGALANLALAGEMLRREDERKAAEMSAMPGS